MNTSSTGAAAPMLHWSFDQNHSRTQPNFGAGLLAILRDYYQQATPAPAGCTTYRVLPNFWSGYQRAPVADLAIGSVEVVRTAAPAGDQTGYRVTAANTTSGEHAAYAFSVAADRWRSLTASWRIEVRNDAGDGYRRYAAAGILGERGRSGGRPIRLTVNGATLPVATWSGNLPLTTPWALLDLLPELEGGCELALLEDLERLREPVRVTPIGTWRWPPPDADLGTFTGWCAHGPGLLPTYYWVDGGGAVAVVSGLFQTWVLSEAEPGDAA